MPAARENEVGRCHCPVCRSDRARLRVSAKSLPYIVCDACNVQVFARSDRSDEKLRALLISEPKPDDEKTLPAMPPGAPAVVPAPAAPKQRASMGWGVFG